MAGSLSHPNLIKDVYKQLVFYKDSDGKYYRDNGSSDVELVIGGGHTGINNDLAWLRFTTTSTVGSGKLFEVNNNSASIFSLDTNGTLQLKAQSSAPASPVAGQIYFDSSTNSLNVGI